MGGSRTGAEDGPDVSPASSPWRVLYCNSIAMLLHASASRHSLPAHVWSCHDRANQHMGGSART